MTTLLIDDCDTTPNPLVVNKGDVVTFSNAYRVEVKVKFNQGSPFSSIRKIKVPAKVAGNNGTHSELVTNNGGNYPFKVSGVDCKNKTTISGEIDVNP